MSYLDPLYALCSCMPPPKWACGYDSEQVTRDVLCAALVKTEWKHRVYVFCPTSEVEASAKDTLVAMIKELAEKMVPAGKNEPIQKLKELASLLLFGTPSTWPKEPERWVSVGITSDHPAPGWLRSKLTRR
jgi:hypothetical protein